MKTIEECKNEIASNNNFDTFKRVVRYTFNRELLQSEAEFLNKIIDESMQLYADQRMRPVVEGLSLLRELAVRTQVMFPRTPQELKWFEQGTENSGDFIMRLNGFFDSQRPENDADNLYENLD